MIEKAATVGRNTLFIMRDECPPNPRKDRTNFGHMVCWHAKYDLGDSHTYDSPHYFITDLLDNPEFNTVSMPLYLYDHSGLTVSTAPFSCPWDSGQVGWIYVTYEEIEKDFGVVDLQTTRAVKEILRSEVKDYNAYLSGECYGFRLFDGLHEVDSSWGFLGSIEDLVDVIGEYVSEKFRPLISKLENCAEKSIAEYLVNKKIVA